MKVPEFQTHVKLGLISHREERLMRPYCGQPAALVVALQKENSDNHSAQKSLSGNCSPLSTLSTA
jgi:hypothetical protein